MTTAVAVTKTGTAVATTAKKSAFNYATDLVAGADPRDLERCRDQINASLGVLKKASVLIRDIGEDLVAAKALVGHGKWGAWLSASFGWGSERTAQRYMEVYRDLGHIDSDILSDLDKGTLYDLCKSSSTDPVRKDIIDRMASGTRFTDKMVSTWLDSSDRADKAAKAKKARKVAPAAAPAAAKTSTPPVVTLNGDEATALMLLRRLLDRDPEGFDDTARLVAELSPAFRKVLADHRATPAAAADEPSVESETIEASAPVETAETETVETVTEEVVGEPEAAKPKPAATSASKRPEIEELDLSEAA